MFTDVLKEITDRLDSRFIMTLFFPSLVFWGGLVLVFAVDKGLAQLFTQWRAQDIGVQLMQIIIVIAWITFFSYLLSNQLVWLTKQFEGYWEWIPLIGNRMVKSRQKYYQQVLSGIDLKVDYEKIYYGFPFPNELEEVMPTRLGNIMKNAEQYSNQRYDMDAVLMWPRIYAVLPENYMKILEGSKASLDFMLVTSCLSIIFAIISGLYLLVVQGTWWIFLLCFLGGLIFARIAYESGLSAAISYGQLIKSTFDLYRDDLRKQLGFERPKSLDKERVLWKNVYALLYKGEAENIDALKYHIDKESGG